MPAWGLCVFSLGLAWLGLWRTRLRLFGVAIMAAGLASPLLRSSAGPAGVRRRAADRVAHAAGGIPAGRRRAARSSPGMPGRNTGRSARSCRWRTIRSGRDPVRGRTACLLRPYADRPGALLARGAAHPAGCGQVSVIVSGEPARGLCPRPWPALVDRFTVWRYGSAAIWLEPDGARVLTDRAARGDRPWVPPPPKPRAPAASALPPALVDEAVQPGPSAGVPRCGPDNGE